MAKDKDGAGWFFIGALLGLIAGATIVGSGKRKENVLCPECNRAVPIKAPMCPWCRTPFLWIDEDVE